MGNDSQSAQVTTASRTKGSARVIPGSIPGVQDPCGSSAESNCVLCVGDKRTPTVRERTAIRTKEQVCDFFGGKRKPDGSDQNQKREQGIDQRALQGNASQRIAQSHITSRVVRVNPHSSRMKSAIALGVSVEKPTKSLECGSSGWLMVNPLETIPTTASLACGRFFFRRYASSA